MRLFGRLLNAVRRRRAPNPTVPLSEQLPTGNPSPRQHTHHTRRVIHEHHHRHHHHHHHHHSAERNVHPHPQGVDHTGDFTTSNDHRTITTQSSSSRTNIHVSETNSHYNDTNSPARQPVASSSAQPEQPQTALGLSFDGPPPVETRRVVPYGSIPLPPVTASPDSASPTLEYVDAPAVTAWSVHPEPPTSLGLTFNGPAPTEIGRLAVTSVSASPDVISPPPASVTYPAIASLSLVPLTALGLTLDEPTLASVSAPLEVINLESAPPSINAEALPLEPRGAQYRTIPLPPISATPDAASATLEYADAPAITVSSFIQPEPSTALGTTFDGSSPTEISRFALTSVSATADGFSPAPPYTVDPSASVTYPTIASSSLQAEPLTARFLTFDAPALPSVSSPLDAISLSSVPASPATPAPPYAVDAPASVAYSAIASPSLQPEPLTARGLALHGPALPSVFPPLEVINFTDSESAVPSVNAYTDLGALPLEPSEVPYRTVPLSPVSASSNAASPTLDALALPSSLAPIDTIIFAESTLPSVNAETLAGVPYRTVPLPPFSDTPDAATRALEYVNTPETTAGSSIHPEPPTALGLAFDEPAATEIGRLAVTTVSATPGVFGRTYHAVDAPASVAHPIIVPSSLQVERLTARGLTSDGSAPLSVTSTLDVIRLTSSESESVSATPHANPAPILALTIDRPQTHTLAPPQESLVLSNGLRLPGDLWSARNLKLNIQINAGDFFNILASCPLLEKLDVTIVASDGIPASVSSASLTDLSVTTSVDTRPLLEVLRAPNLKMLHLEWDRANHLDRVPNDPDIGLWRFLQSSRCSLRTLSLVDMFSNEVQLIDCLKHRCLSHLQSLIVRNPKYLTSEVDFRGRVISQSTFTALSQFYGTKPLCPNLVRLELSPCFAPDGKLASMMEARGSDSETFESTFALSYMTGTSAMNLQDKSRLQLLCGRHPNWMIIEEAFRREYP